MHRPATQSRQTRAGHTLVIVRNSDMPVAEEATITAELMGNEVEQLCVVGVAGLHRLLANRDILTRVRVY